MSQLQAAWAGGPVSHSHIKGRELQGHLSYLKLLLTHTIHLFLPFTRALATLKQKVIYISSMF